MTTGLSVSGVSVPVAGLSVSGTVHPAAQTCGISSGEKERPKEGSFSLERTKNSWRTFKEEGREDTEVPYVEPLCFAEKS